MSKNMSRPAYAARHDDGLPANTWQPGLGRDGRLWEATAVRFTRDQTAVRSRNLLAQALMRRRVPASLLVEVAAAVAQKSVLPLEVP